MPPDHWFESPGWSLFDAVCIPDVSVLTKLLDEGVDDLNQKGICGRTAVIQACVYGHDKHLKLLLDRGAQINTQDSFGYTALMQAARYSFIECVQLLLERGADMSIRNMHLDTAKDIAKKKLNVDLVQFLDEFETQVLKTLKEENDILKTEIEVWKERELSKNNEILFKQELVNEYKTRSKSVEEEGQRIKKDLLRAEDEIRRFRDDIQRGNDEVSCLKENEIRLNSENDILKLKVERLQGENEFLNRREEELRLERDKQRVEWSARAMFQSVISSLISGVEDRKRKRNDDEEKK